MGYEQARELDQAASEHTLGFKAYSRPALHSEAQLTLLGPTTVSLDSAAYSEYLTATTEEAALSVLFDNTHEVNPLQERLEF